MDSQKIITDRYKHIAQRFNEEVGIVVIEVAVKDTDIAKGKLDKAYKRWLIDANKFIADISKRKIKPKKNEGTDTTTE